MQINEYNDSIEFNKLQKQKETISAKEFEECVFIDCDFSECNLHDSNFIDCTFTNCNLSLVSLVNTGLKSVVFNDCKITGVDFSVCSDFLLSLEFNNCQLDLCNFQDKKLINTQYINCSLKEAFFAETNLEKAGFTESNLLGATFDYCNLKEADFTTAFNYLISPNNNKVKKAKFSKDGLSGLLHEFSINIS